MIKVSVIVPVYNGKEHLRQCLDSILNQTLQEIELICVDDGSTDTSLQILQEYMEQDSRVQLYHQQNKYAGAARNIGKGHATGEYLVFWDCDDFFELDALEELYNKAASLQADICVCGADKFHEAQKKLEPGVKGYLQTKRLPEAEVFNRTSNNDYILNFTNAVVWNKIFRREFIESTGLDFQELRNANDIWFVVHALCLAERITTLDKTLVFYRVKYDKGLVGTLSESPLSTIKALVDTAESLRKLQAFPEQSFANKALTSMIYVLRNLQVYDAFAQAVECLQAGALDRMGITANREEGFYYVQWHQELVEHLTKDAPQQFLTYLAHLNYIKMSDRLMEKHITEQRLKNTRVKAKKDTQKYKGEIKNYQNRIKSYQKELKEVRNSYSFRIGKTITWLPRKVKRLFRGNRHSGSSVDV